MQIEPIVVIYGNDCQSTMRWVKDYYEYFTVDDVNGAMAIYLEDLKIGLDNLDDFEAIILENIRSAGEEFLSFIFKRDFKDLEILNVTITEDYQIKYLVRRPI